MVLQPAARGIECVANGDVHVLVRVVLARLPVDHDLAARNIEIDAHMIDLALAMTPVGSLQRHPAAALRCTWVSTDGDVSMPRNEIWTSGRINPS